jgi:hypothetical protein
MAQASDYNIMMQGILIEAEGSAQLTSLYKLVSISCFLSKILLTFYLNEEVNGTEPSPSVSVS